MLLDTAAANVTLVDVSSLAYSLNTTSKIMTGNTDTRLNYRTTIKKIYGQAKANAYVKLQWQGSTNTEIITITTGDFNYNLDDLGGGNITNTETLGSNGDILFSVITPATDTLTLFIDLKKDGIDYDQGQTADPAAFNR